MNLKVKNISVLAPVAEHEAHAFVTYRVDKNLHGEDIFEEIAIGQTLGAWDDRFVDTNVLKDKVAKIIQVEEDTSHLRGTIAFPFQLWHGNLSWLLTLIYGKMSFYRGVGLEKLSLDPRCFAHPGLTGPKLQIADLRKRVGMQSNHPLLMGILKPNVAMSADALSDLYAEVAHAGVHLVKDDEIRHDSTLDESLRRIEKVAARKAKDNLKTLYVAHAPIDSKACADLGSWSAQIQNAGADALLVNVWTAGLQTLQTLRTVTNLPLVAHPALAGSFSQGSVNDPICASVSLGSLIRAAGADLSLFPSPYGKIGLPSDVAIKLARTCAEAWPGEISPTIPVPSAGIKPEHVAQACEDFGRDFILNAGTAIFASGRSVADSAKDFLTRLETINHAR